MDAEILDLSGMDLDAQYLRQQSQPHHQQHQQHRLSCGSSHSAFTSPTSPSRRESTMSSDSGYHHMMTPLSADGGGCSRRLVVWLTQNLPSQKIEVWI